jgi:hypothetical protein
MIKLPDSSEANLLKHLRRRDYLAVQSRGMQALVTTDPKWPKHKCIPYFGVTGQITASIGLPCGMGPEIDDEVEEAGVLSVAGSDPGTMRPLGPNVCLVRGLWPTTLLRGIDCEAVGILSERLPDGFEQHFAGRCVVIIKGKLDADQIARALRKVDASVFLTTLPEVAFLKELTAVRIQAVIQRVIKLAEPVEPSFG